MKTLARVLSEMIAAFAAMLVVCMIFVSVMLPQEAEGAETERAYVTVIQIVVDGLDDKFIAITDEGLAVAFDQTDLGDSEPLWLFLQEAHSKGIVFNLDIQTPCGVRAQ